MAGNNVRKRLQEEITCSLCLDFFTDPVIMECGHNFCQTCILTAWNRSNTVTASCPQCRKTVSKKTSRPNRQLANLVDLVKELNDEDTGGLCESHQEPLKFFCKDDEAPICVVCERSKGHRVHWVVPVEEATEEYKDIFRTSLEKSKEEFLACKEDIEKQSQDLLDMVERERQKIVAWFRDLWHFLKEKEKHLLDQMKEAHTEIVKKRDEEMARVSEELSSLENTILEMEEKCEKSPHEFLKDIKSMLQRCEQKKFKNPVAFPLALKWRIWDFSDFSPILEKVIKDFKETLKSGLERRKETVILDPQTAHSQLLISENGKCLTLGDKQQCLPNNTHRFVHQQYVLGSECFQSGIHCWEVEVGNEEGWAFGICNGYYSKQTKTLLSPEDGVWAIGKWKGQYRAVAPPVNPPLPLSEEPKKIRVSLNSTAHRVAFFDADTVALLYSSKIHGSLQFPFFWLWKKSCLRLSQ